MSLVLRRAGTDQTEPILLHTDAGRDANGYWVDHFQLKDKIITIRWKPAPGQEVSAEARVAFIAEELLGRGFELFVDGFPVHVAPRTLKPVDAEKLADALLLAKPGRLLPLDDAGNMSAAGVTRCVDAIVVLAAALETKRKQVRELADLTENAMACGHLKANLQPTDGTAEACIVCAEITDIAALSAAQRRMCTAALALRKTEVEVAAAGSAVGRPMGEVTKAYADAKREYREALAAITAAPAKVEP